MKQTFKILSAGGISLYKIWRLIWCKFLFPNNNNFFDIFDVLSTN